MHNHSSSCHSHCNHDADILNRVDLPQRSLHSPQFNQDHGSKVRLLTTVLVLVFSFSGIEIAVGWFSHSLALQADAGHLFSDCFALVLALGATWLSRRVQANNDAPNQQNFEAIAALINGLGLLWIAIWIAWEAIARLQSPAPEILSLPMLITAIVGLGVNSMNISLLHNHSHHDLNLKGAFLHVFADAISSVGVIIAAIAVWSMNWLWADGVVSLLVAALILISAIPLITESSKMLQANPE